MSLTPSDGGKSAAGRYKWAVVGMLWTVCVVNYADRQAFAAILPALKGEFGFSAVQLGLMGSAFAWIYAFGSPIAGYVGDRMRRKDMILGACLFWSAITAVTGFCGKLWSFIAVRALTGLGETVYFPAAVSMVGDYHGRKSRSFALSLHQTGVYFGSIAGSWLGARLAETMGWRIGFYLFGAAGVVLALILGKVLAEPARERASERPENPMSVGETLQALGKRPTALVLMAVFAGANFVATIFLTWTPTFLVDKFHFGLSSAGFSGSAYINLASLVSVPLGGYFADRFARSHAGGRILVQACGLLFGAAFVAIVGLAETLPWLLGSMVVFGLCKGIYDSNIFASVCDVVEPRARASATGLMNTVGWAGGALGPLAVGIATTYGRHGTDTVANMSEAIAFGAVIYVAGAGALIWAGLKMAPRDVVAASAEAGPAHP